ncbi:DNA polymerase [Bradyrhizobium sp. SZCCHNRI2049]|uniref:DNA polymerase n=1 Tax=Bradyrhizobium sp. SZCCHNRI2049 TaxID=3057287 RepID=UPI002916C491|nr:DNA polymerase [Bradyrhizobium sp. SZCCHNRI2049]
MNVVVFDVEGNGFLDNITKLHCLALANLTTGHRKSFEPDMVEHGVREVMEADLIIGHNVIKYDLAVLSKLYPWFRVKRDQVVDTLVLSRLIYSDIGDRDRAKPHDQRIEPKLWGSHSLKAWGQRLGFPKGDYDGGFDEYSPEMLEYNERDVEVSIKLYELLRDHVAFSERASELEHEVAWIIAQQERYGFTFDVERARALAGELFARRHSIEAKLQEIFPPWDEELGLFTPKVNNAKLGYVKGVPVMKTKRMEFNPGSRHHIANRLKAIHNWQPKAFTPDGSAKIDETILEGLPYPEAAALAEYFMVQKRIGMLAEGKGAWLKYERGGKIHGECITNGAVTGRATHKSPNVAQVPSVGTPYGKECRQLFGPSKGRVQVGIDVSGLELRMLAHFMHRYDKGAYGREVVEGDVHTINQKAAGLETRAQAKTFIYAFLYGAGPEKIGSIAGKGAQHGRLLRTRFLRRTPALKKLLDAIKAAASRGYLKGLDGRRLAVRSAHSAPNTLLQSAGALVCKRWMVELDRAIPDDWREKLQQLAWVHDELQFECDEDIAEELGQLAVECIKRAGDYFGIKVPLTGEYKIGRNWAECH